MESCITGGDAHNQHIGNNTLRQGLAINTTQVKGHPRGLP